MINFFKKKINKFKLILSLKINKNYNNLYYVLINMTNFGLKILKFYFKMKI